MLAASRLEGVRARLRREQVDALAVVDVRNVAYITGFEGVFDDEPAHVLLVTETAATLFTDSRYVSAATAAAEGSACEVRLVTTELIEWVCSAARDAGVKRLALESSLPYWRFGAFQERFGEQVVPAANWIEALREVKEPAEIERIVAAQEITDRAFEHIAGAIRSGASERDVALDLEFFMRRAGSDGVAFAPIVASGPNSALPHATPSGRVFAHGDFVVLDFGARVDGYCADMTRTVVIGKASERQREIYDTVLAANIAGASAVQAGLPGREIDAVARAVIAERGFGEYFGHGLGHGVGREVHELPGVGPRNDAAIPLGSVVTIEPGIYIPGFGGVRIEDLAVVEEAGARVLTRSTKDLLEL